jgi:hypothetical protein
MKKHQQFKHPMQYHVTMTETHIRAGHVKWLETNMNGYRTRWDYGGINRINFANEQDQIMFVLRWA